MSREKGYQIIGGSWFEVVDPLPEQCRPWFIGRSRMLPGYHVRTETSFSGTWYVIVVESGPGELVIDGRRTSTDGAFVALLDGGIQEQNWYYRGSKETDISGGFFLTGPWVQRIAPQLQAACGGLVTATVDMPLFERWRSVTRQVHHPPYLLTGAQAFSWCAEILSVFTTGTTTSKDRDAVSQLRTRLLADLPARMTLAQHARQLGYSREHLERAFSRVHGLAPGAWRNRERMLLAARLLTASDQPLKAIAEACGFSSVTNFARAFQRHTGASPGAYRDRPFAW